MKDGFPRMPHFPGSTASADDVHLDDVDAAALLASEVIVTEKLDGLRVELARGRGGKIEARLKRPWRGTVDVERALAIYVAQREAQLAPLLQRGGAVYGEWLLHRMRIAYDRLPDLFVAFALRDGHGRFLPNDEALPALAVAGLTAARPLLRGRPGSLAALRRLLGRSGCGSARMEGLVVAVCGAGPERCGKWVERGYVPLTPTALTGAHNVLAAEDERLVEPMVRGAHATPRRRGR